LRKRTDKMKLNSKWHLATDTSPLFLWACLY